MHHPPLLIQPEPPPCTTYSPENSLWMQGYEPNVFRQLGHQVVDMLADYLEQALPGPETMAVLPHISPEEMRAHWPGDFTEAGLIAQSNQVPTDALEISQAFSTHAVPILQKILAQSNHLHHPHYIGHQVASVLPVTALFDMVDSFLNNGTAIYEMGPHSTAMEEAVVRWMGKMAGFGDAAGGVLTSGGTLGNLTALLAARQCQLMKQGYSVWEKGYRPSPCGELAILVSDQAHYSIQRAAQVMGLGQEGVILVKTGNDYKMSAESLAQAFQQAIDLGKKPFAVVGSACSTATGRFDPLNVVADFALAHGLWFHVDGAHGAPTLLSNQYKPLIQGVERADSLVWDAHKMMMMPALITGVIFKDAAHSYQAFAQQASYIFQNQDEPEWYNLGKRTFECTKKMLSLKLYASLKLFGVGFFRQFVDHVYTQTRQFEAMLNAVPDFEVATPVESNIICFRYLGNPALERGTSDTPNETLNQLQRDIRAYIVDSGSFYIVSTSLNGNVYLRCTVMNPTTGSTHFETLMNIIRQF